jgi:hypothetical protein
MSSDFVNGSKYAFSTTLGAAVAISAITNAAPPAITATSMPGDDDIILLQSNWSDLADTAVYTDSLGHLFGLDTTNTDFFPPGESEGSYQLVGGFTSLTQIREVAQSGGDTNSFNYAYIEDRSTRQRSKPTDKNPLVLTFTLDRDATLPWFDALDKLDKSRQLVTMRETFTTGEQLLYTGFVSFQKSPSRTRNENMTVTATFSVNSEIISVPASFPSGS